MIPTGKGPTSLVLSAPATQDYKSYEIIVTQVHHMSYLNRITIFASTMA